jgi:hypothetical protein
LIIDSPYYPGGSASTLARYHSHSLSVIYFISTSCGLQEVGGGGSEEAVDALVVHALGIEDEEKFTTHVKVEPTATWDNGLSRRCIGVFFTLPELYLLIIGHLKVVDVGAILSHYVDVATHYHLDVLDHEFLPSSLKMVDARPDRIKFKHGLAAVHLVKKLIPPVEVDKLEGCQGDEGLVRVLECDYVVARNLATPLMWLQN